MGDNIIGGDNFRWEELKNAPLIERRVAIALEQGTSEEDLPRNVGREPVKTRRTHPEERKRGMNRRRRCQRKAEDGQPWWNKPPKEYRRKQRPSQRREHE
jgi:hypothetical protein